MCSFEKGSRDAREGDFPPRWSQFTLGKRGLSKENGGREREGVWPEIVAVAVRPIHGPSPAEGGCPPPYTYASAPEGRLCSIDRCIAKGTRCHSEARQGSTWPRRWRGLAARLRAEESRCDAAGKTRFFASLRMTTLLCRTFDNAGLNSHGCESILHLRGPQGAGCHAFAKQKHVLNDPPHAFASESVAPIYNNDAKCSRARGNEMPRIPTVFLSAWVQPSGPGSASRQAPAPPAVRPRHACRARGRSPATPRQSPAACPPRGEAAGRAREDPPSICQAHSWAFARRRRV